CLPVLTGCPPRPRAGRLTQSGTAGGDGLLAPRVAGGGTKAAASSVGVSRLGSGVGRADLHGRGTCRERHPRSADFPAEPCVDHGHGRARGTGPLPPSGCGARVRGRATGRSGRGGPVPGTSSEPNVPLVGGPERQTRVESGDAVVRA